MWLRVDMCFLFNYIDSSNIMLGESTTKCNKVSTLHTCCIHVVYILSYLRVRLSDHVL